MLGFLYWGSSHVARSEFPSEMLRASARFLAPCRFLSEGVGNHCALADCRPHEYAAFGTEMFPAYPYSIQLVSNLAFLNFTFLRMKNCNVFMARYDTTSVAVVGKHFILANFIPLAS